MKIGDVAEASGLTAKTIRYYEDIGLIRPLRGENGYRDFAGADVHKLRFLARARSLGFSINECRMLLSLYEDRSRASADVKAVAEAHLAPDRPQDRRPRRAARHTRTPWWRAATATSGPTARSWTISRARLPETNNEEKTQSSATSRVCLQRANQT